MTEIKATDKVLEINKLSYSYVANWSLRKSEAIKEISLDVKVGEVFGFLGHNGAGKTTTIKCILGLIRQSSGTVQIFGKSNADLTQRSLVGYLPEQPYFYDYLTVNELLEMYAYLSGLRGNEVKTAVKDVLGKVKMTNRSNSSMRTLSKGLTQRVGLAQAIIAKPKLLILDEPFSGLDPIGRKEFRQIFSELKADGTAMLMSSHVLSDVEFLCDRVSIMSQGAIKGIFDIRDKSSLGTGHFELVLRNFERYEAELSVGSESQVIINDARGKYLRLIFKEQREAEQMLTKALALTVNIESYEFVHGTLEDLFIKLVQFDEGGDRGSASNRENDRIQTGESR